MATDPETDALYDDGPDMEDMEVRAVRTMPFYGQVLSWFLWRMPYLIYVLVIAGGIALCFYERIGPGVGTTMGGFIVLVICWYVRTNYSSPWTFAVIQTVQAVPGDLRAAAAAGEPVPPEDQGSAT